MLKSYSFIVVCLVLFGHAWASEDFSNKPIVDEKFREVENEIKKDTDKCREKEKNVVKRFKCGKALRKKYEKQGQFRGTDEYCKKHYGKLGFGELRKIWMEIKQQRRKARINPDEDVSGEVTEGMFMVEEIWVESRLAQIQRERTEATEKEVFKESEKGRGQ